ncbi:MAG: hypothetical protein M0Z31_11490 [Clostridia bacterium]|nr:hypothetical protein [Clostridia bacterium]
MANKKKKSKPVARKKTWLTWPWLVAGVIVLGGIIYFATGSGSKAVANPTYASDIRPVLQNNCARCHGPGGMRSDAPLISYGGVSKYVTPGQWSSSTLAQKIDGGSMSKFISPDERELIKKWVEQGAKEE